MNSNDEKPKANGFGDNGDNGDVATFSQKICDDGMYEFLNNYYKEFNPVG